METPQGPSETQERDALSTLSREQLICRVEKLQDELDSVREQIQVQQITDSLTGLANRDYFFASLSRLWRRANRFRQSVCLALIDIDDFREINEKYGYLAGDLVLTGLSDTLRTVVRDYDLLARFGEEEFVIAIDNGDSSTAQQFGQRIRKAIAEMPVCVNDRVIPVTVTVGIAIGKPELIGDKPESLVCAAIEACEIARRKGSSQVHSIQLQPVAS